jgi:seryl-tRNA synthetase
LQGGGQVVRDMKKILETLQDQEEKQKLNKVQLIDAVLHLSQTVKELAVSTAETFVKTDEKSNIMKDFIARQAEEITALKLRVNNLEDVITNHEAKLNAKN